MNKKDGVKKLTVACPRCKIGFDYYSSLFRPFCSERCKLIDFGHWMNETYAVPIKSDSVDEDLENKNEKEDGSEDE